MFFYKIFFSTKSDIWSLGVVLWEVFSYGQPPYMTLTGEQTAVYVIEGGILEKPTGCSPDIYSIMKSCWNLDRHERPTANYLAERLASKSSIYYGPLQPRPTSTHSAENTVQLPIKNGSAGRTAPTSPLPPHPPQTGAGSSVSSPTTPVSSKGNTSTQASNSASRRQVVYATKLEEYSREYMENSIREHNNEQRLHGSTSESSLAGLGANGKDDITRKSKIRKSLRKVLQVKTTRRKSANSSKADRNSIDSTDTRNYRNTYHN